MHSGVSGIVTPTIETLATFHPGFALAVMEGVELRPNVRTIEGVFSSVALNTPIEASFDQQITGYSVFSGCDITIDPTNEFNGNLFKGLNDATAAIVTGITVDLLVQSHDEHNYAPVPEQTPLQIAHRVLSRSAGLWAMDMPDNVRARFTLIATPPTEGPLTVWMVFSFLVLGEGGRRYLPPCMDHAAARRMLRDKYGLGCGCASAGGALPPTGGSVGSGQPPV